MDLFFSLCIGSFARLSVTWLIITFFSLLRWKSIEAVPKFPPRFGHKAVATSEGVLVVGGCAERVLEWHQNFILLNTASFTWRFITSPVWSEHK